MNIQSLGRHQKSWGYEIVWASNEQYCGKILVLMFIIESGGRKALWRTGRKGGTGGKEEREK